MIKPIILILLMGVSINQTHMQYDPPTLNNQEVIELFLDGFNNPENFQVSMDLLADDYTFRNPLIQTNSKDEFIALAQEMGKILTGVEIQYMAQSGDWVAVWYEFSSVIQVLEKNQGTEWFKVENGIIQESFLIYDATQWRNVYSQMK